MANIVSSAMNTVWGAFYPEETVLTKDELLSLCSSKEESNLIQVLSSNPVYNLNCVDSNGHSPLMLVCARGWIEAVALFIKAEGIAETINYQDSEGITALLVACSLGHEKIVGLLLTIEKLDTNLSNKLGLPPLAVSISTKSPSIASLLIDDHRTLLNQALPQNLMIENQNLGGNTPSYLQFDVAAYELSEL